jgi:hypothetical protein
MSDDKPWLWKKGERRVGRVKGVPNKRTVECRGVLEQAVKLKGGAKGLVEWIDKSDENAMVFWSQMFMRLVPAQLEVQSSSEMTVRVTREELARQLEERGLPPIVFGCDVPQIDHQVGEIIEGKVIDNDRS